MRSRQYIRYGNHVTITKRRKGGKKEDTMVATNARPRAPGGTGGKPRGNGVSETVFWVDGREFEVTFPSMLYVWDVAGAARGGEEQSNLHKMASTSTWPIDAYACYSTRAYSYTPLGSFRPSRRVALTLIVTVGALGVATVILNHRGCSCECKGKKTCETWSCHRPLAHGLHDEWPQWPPVAPDAIPRDNLPNPAAQQRWLELHRAQAAEAASADARTRIAFLGDSITEGWLRSGFSDRGLSVAQPRCEAHWRHAFSGWHPLNLAIGGDRAQDLGWRLQHGLLPAALQPRAFFVMIGTNDLGNGERWDVAASEVRLVVEQLHAARPTARIVLHGLLPRGSDEGTPRTRSFHRAPWWSAAHNPHYESITRVNAALEAFAAERGGWLTYVDCSALFLAEAADPADQLVAEGSTSTSRPGSRAVGGTGAVDGASDYARRRYIPLHLMYDLLHLTPEGYRLWAGCLKPRMAVAVGEAPMAPSTHAPVAEATPRHPRELRAEGAPRCIGRSCRGNDLDLARRRGL